MVVVCSTKPQPSVDEIVQRIKQSEVEKLEAPSVEPAKPIKGNAFPSSQVKTKQSMSPSQMRYALRYTNRSRNDSAMAAAPSPTPVQSSSDVSTKDERENSLQNVWNIYNIHIEKLGSMEREVNLNKMFSRLSLQYAKVDDRLENLNSFLLNYPKTAQAIEN